MKPLIKNLLFVLGFIFIMLVILFLNTYIHEQAHINSAKEQNISFKLRNIEWKPQIDGWGSGFSIPTNQEECEKFNSLLLENKQKITHGGVKAEFLFISSLLFISLFILIKYVNRLWHHNWVLFVLLILFNLLFFVMIFYTFKGNVFTSNPQADWNFLNFSDCSIYG